MTFLEAFLLAVVQGLTEFLPVSSSGHLVVADALLGSRLGGEEKEAFFVLLHMASFLAVLIRFLPEIARLLRGPDARRATLAIVIGCIPAGLAGVGLKLSGAPGLFDTPWIAGVGWLICAAFLFVARRSRRRAPGSLLEGTGALPVAVVLAIGVAQAVAIVPGISRSGMTIAAAVVLGVSPREGFRFSFLMALPLILGAQLLELGALGGLSAQAGMGVLATGFVACLVVSLFALLALERVVDASRLHWFTPYCALAGIVTLALVVTGVL